MTMKRALIVDDSSTAQYRLKKMLRAYPLDIDIVDSGEAALRYLAHHSPDVIFMDHLMPGMDGFRALQIIKSHPETAMIPVIMYTSKSGDVYTGQARALGALDVVSKDRINATDLSKVMENIHITPIKQSAADEPAPVESAELIAAANQVTDIQEPRVERRSSGQASQEQARSLELRLSHLEHSLEDNRRFITSRVVRELQALRQGIKQEFSEVLAKKAPPPDQELPAPIEAIQAADTGLSLTSKIIALIGLAAIGYLLAGINNQLSENQEQQVALSTQLQQVLGELNRESALLSPALDNVRAQNLPTQTSLSQTQTAQTTPTTTAPNLYADSRYLEDIAWTFNQSSELAFHQNTLDPQPLLRLHELLHRVASNGFKGTANISLYVGDFCVTVNNVGIAQLAPSKATLGDCMLSSELYVIERMADDYARDAGNILNNLSRSVNSTLRVEISASEGSEPYPERFPTVDAQEWNRIAQQNNKIQLELEPDKN